MTRCAKCKKSSDQTPLFPFRLEWFCAKCIVILNADGRLRKDAA